MSNSESPSAYWSREHRRKVKYQDPFSAERAAIRLTEERGLDGRKWEAYECRWAQWYWEGKTGNPHWHVGRKGRRHQK